MSALVGIGMAIVLILVGMILKGGTIASIISPPAFVMVMGATFGVMMASSGMGTVGLMMKLSLGRRRGARGSWPWRPTPRTSRTST